MKTEKILFPQVADENQKNWAELKAKLGEKEKSWMMCLGAGVSISAGLPNWYKLLAQISARILPPAMQSKMSDTQKSSAYYVGVEKFYEKLSYDDVFWDKLANAFDGAYEHTFSSINVLEAAEYVRNSLYRALGYSGSDEKMNGNSRKQVDSQMNFLIQQACSIDVDVSLANHDLQKKTLAAVANLMKSDKDQLIHNVITYNYDNLLETYLRNISGCAPEKVHSIVKKDQLKDFGDNTEWNIYHVHGRIPVVPYPGEEMSESVILTESDYYQEEQINYSWTNILQSYAMLRSNLIFIGFSGTDYNFRRIVKYVNQENSISQDRYIFFSVDDIVKAVFTREKKTEEELKVCIQKMSEDDSEYAFEKFFINYLIYAQTVYWEQHGLKVIWSSHDEIFDDLQRLHLEKEKDS